jgi:hypothetical protein
MIRIARIAAAVIVSQALGIPSVGAERLPKCRLAFKGVRGSVLAQVARDGQCLFAPSICANEPATGCRPPGIASIDVHSRPAGIHLELPLLAGTERACSAPTRIALLLDRANGASRLTLRVTARDARRRARARRKMTLKCIPPVSGGEGVDFCGVGLAQPVPLVGRRADFPPSIPVPMSCFEDGKPSNYVNESCHLDGTAELHVVSVYEGALRREVPSDGGAPGDRTVDVHVHASETPVVLYLGSYQPVRWQLRLDSDAALARVYTSSPHEIRVDSIPDGVPVISLGYGNGLGCMYGWEVGANLDGCNYWRTIETVRRVTGLTESSFQGCYSGDTFDVPYLDDAPAPERHTFDAREYVAREEVSVPHCEAVMAEKHYCLTLGGTGPAVVGLDTGTVCPVTSTDAPLGDLDAGASIAWRGETVYVCTAEGLIVISLRDGQWQALQVPCSGVTDDRGWLLIKPSLRDPLFWEALLDPTRRTPGHRIGLGTLFSVPNVFDDVHFPYDLLDTSTQFITAQDGFVYGAPHATDAIQVADLVTDQPLDLIPLQGFDDWILGLSMTDDGRLVLAGSQEGREMAIFDADTGRRIRTLRASEPLRGLSCVQGGPVQFVQPVVDSRLRRED